MIAEKYHVASTSSASFNIQTSLEKEHILIWGNACKIYKIFELQKWAIRTTANSHNGSHTGPRFLKFNVLNVHDTFKLTLGTFMYKHHSNKLPSIFSPYFTRHVQTHHYPTRNAQDYVSIKQRKCVLTVLLEIVNLFSGILWTKRLSLAKPLNTFEIS